MGTVPKYPTRSQLGGWAERQGREGAARRAMNDRPPRRWPSPVRVGAVIFAFRHLPR